MQPHQNPLNPNMPPASRPPFQSPGLAPPNYPQNRPVQTAVKPAAGPFAPPSRPSHGDGIAHELSALRLAAGSSAHTEQSPHGQPSAFPKHAAPGSLYPPLGAPRQNPPSAPEANPSPVAQGYSGFLPPQQGAQHPSKAMAGPTHAQATPLAHPSQYPPQHQVQQQSSADPSYKSQPAIRPAHRPPYPFAPQPHQPSSLSSHPAPGSSFAPPTPSTSNHPLVPKQMAASSGPPQIAAGSLPQPHRQPVRPHPPLGVASPDSSARSNPSSLRPVPPATPLRPLPGTTTSHVQYPSNGYPGVANGGTTTSVGEGFENGPDASASQANSAAPSARLTSSMMPRPCALEPPCGSPRPFHYRGINTATASGPQQPTMTVPATNSDFIAVDDGSARIRYVRLTTGAVATDPNVMSKSGVPLAIILSPFADCAPGEAPIPVVDLTNLGGGGPLRCEKCFGYSNPGFRFINGGAQFHCNLCRHLNMTPQEHFSPVAPSNGLRMDADTRHEFRFGSVEYIVGSSSYITRPPKPPSYVFALDISANAVVSGLATSAVASLKAALKAGILPGAACGARVGIITFDKELQYYDARGSDEGRSVAMCVVPDVNEPFMPLGGDAFFLKPNEAIAALESIMEIHQLRAGFGQPQAQNDQVPVGAKPVTRVECALGAALIAVKTALTETGGKAFIVGSSLPSFGPYKLERRGGAAGGGEEREMALLRPACPDYDILGCELADSQVSVDLWLATAAAYVDAATLARVPRACGGRIFVFSNFDPVRDGASLHRSLCSAVSSVRAFEALLRVRVSTGLETTGEFVGHFGRPQRGDDVSGPVFDSTSSLALELSVTSKLSIDSSQSGSGREHSASYGVSSLYDDICVQTAVLFTDTEGRRRIRVHSVFATKSSVLGDVFKYADVDAVASFFAKKAASAVLGNGSPLSKACDAVIERTAQSLFVYRKHCTSAPLSGQLILPEALKVLPVMMLGLIKSDAFRAVSSAQASVAVSSDERAAALSFLTWATPADIAAVAYPRMWALHKLDAKAGLPHAPAQSPVVGELSTVNGGSSGNSNEPIAMPNSVLLSSEVLEEDALLMIENALRLVIWVGPKADPKLVNDVIAQSAGGRLVIRAETAGSTELVKSVGDSGKKVASIVQRVVARRIGFSQPQVVIRQAPGAGAEAKYVLPLLIEDRPVGNGFNYMEFLRHIHKRVMDKLANESAQNEMQTWEMLNHGY